MAKIEDKLESSRYFLGIDVCVGDKTINMSPVDRRGEAL